MTVYWIHFIGQTYYTIKSFEKEATKYGVSRRISLDTLKKMDWGNVVLLAMKVGRTPVLFGKFEVTGISGLSAEATEKISQKFKVYRVSSGGLLVKRGCGAYIAGPSYLTDASLPELANFLIELKKSGVDIGKPMVKGVYSRHKHVRLKSIPFRQGFRKFNYELFLKELEKAEEKNPSRTPAVKGQFYVIDTEEKENNTQGQKQAGTIQEVYSYKRKEEIQYFAQKNKEKKDNKVDEEMALW